MRNELFRGLRSEREKAKNDLILKFLCCVCLFCLGYFLYQPLLQIGLDDDDRILVEGLTKLRWNEYLFMNDGYRFRPVFQAVILLVWRICGCDTITFIQAMPVLNTLLGIALFLTADYLFKNRLFSFAISSIYLASRFAYYQTMMLFGVMEGTALFNAIVTLLFAMDFVINKRNRSIWFVLLFYVLSVFTHERYLTLIAVVLAAIWLRSYKADEKALPIRKRVIYSAIAVGICGLCLIARQILFHGNAWTGTNGQDIGTTFSIPVLLIFIGKQMLYLLGWGDPETYLSGLSYTQVDGTVTAATILFDAGILALIILYIIAYRKNQSEEKRQNLRGIALAVIFIGACIIASSTTIRVEMRWLYASQTALLLCIGMAALFIIHTCKHKTRIIAIGVTAVMLLCSFYVETAYRKGWPNQYYYPGLMTDNSLMEAVKWYPDIRERDLIIIDPDNRVNTEEVNRFLTLMSVKHRYVPLSIGRYDNLIDYDDYKKGNDLTIEYRNGWYRDITGILDFNQ